MSNMEREHEATACAADPAREAIITYTARDSELGGGLIIRRALPLRERRLIGPWCFLDHFGPLALDDAGRAGMHVGPHPHIGLQTVTWLIEGEVWHKDSLGSDMVIRPQQLNVMTAGRGISHSEETPADHGPMMHGVQLWVALPRAEAHREPAFEHHAALPHHTAGDAALTLIVGSHDGQTSPATVYWPAICLDGDMPQGGEAVVPLDPSFEHGVITLTGALTIDGVALPIGQLAYLGPGRDEVCVRAEAGTRWFLVGGAPFEDEITMWWNFVGTRAEIEAATDEWNARDARFGTVAGWGDAYLPAPATPWKRQP